MYGLHGVHGREAMGAPEQQPDSGVKYGQMYHPDETAAKNKQTFQTWWATVPPEAQAQLIYDFLLLNKAESAHPDSPVWVGLTVQKIEDARKANLKEYLEIIEAALKKDETMPNLAMRLMMYGQAWLADKAAKAAEAANQPDKSSASDTSKLLIGAAVAAGIYWFYFRKRGA